MSHLSIQQVFVLFLPGVVGGIVAVAAPLVLYFSGFQNFIGAVSFVGMIFLPLEGIFIILMWLSANKRSETPPILIKNWMQAFIPVILLVFMIALIQSLFL